MKGRPKSDNTKNVVIRARVDDLTMRKLNAVAKELDITKSEVIRNGINSEYNSMLKCPIKKEVLYK